MAATPQRALIVIDLQNDYFPDGKFPLWNTEAVLAQVESAIARARAQGVPVILVQHIADAPNGAAPFFNAGTSGVELHPRILAAAPDAVVVTKAQADGFLNTTLEEKLAELGVEELLVCGMMTQNCVTQNRQTHHTCCNQVNDSPCQATTSKRQTGTVTGKNCCKNWAAACCQRAHFRGVILVSASTNAPTRRARTSTKTNISP
jgi:hypothetical protein